MKQPLKSAFALSAGVIAIVGLVLAPAAVNAISTTANTTVNAVISPVISMTTSSAVTINITPSPLGSASTSTAADSVQVSTNRSTGYNLKLADSDTVTNLANGANTIAASSGTFAAPTALVNNTWGYRIDGAGTFGAGPTTAQTNVASLAGNWAGVPSSASPVTLKTTATTATNDTTNVWYGAMADTTKPDGSYSDQVTYTATTN